MSERKETLVLLSGTLCNDKLWKHQITALDKNYNVIVGDLTKDDSIRKMAKSILKSVTGNFHLAGLSLGGIVAIEVMKIAPERVKKLILMDTNPMPPTVKQKEMWHHFINITEKSQFEDVTKKYLMPTLLSPENNDEDLKKLIIDMSNDIGPEGLLQQLSALESREDNRGILSTIKNETLVIVGEKDQVCPLSMSQFIHEEISGSKLKIIANAGHLVTLEAPEETTNVVKSFLN